MFEFFEGLIEKLGVKLISNFTDKLFDFIKEVKEKSTGENNDNGKRSAQIGSSGDYAKIGSSGDSAKIGSSGYSAKIGSSGYYAQIGSSGDSAQIGSSGDSAQIGSSGYSAKIGSSGYYAQIGSSGDSAQIGSSGYSAQIDISGDDSVGFACGFKSLIKAKKGTWISLCEYGIKQTENGEKIIPIFALSAQIGNPEYKDFKGRILKENEYYCLSNKAFYPTDESDGILIKKLSEKKRDGITIIKGQTLDIENPKEVYLVKQDELSAHGSTLKEALDDLIFKKMKDTDTKEIIKEIKKTGKVTRNQYRAITGACAFGTARFCEQHNIQDLEEIDLEELRKILINDYGAEKFWSLIDEK